MGACYFVTLFTLLLKKMCKMQRHPTKEFDIISAMLAFK